MKTINRDRSYFENSDFDASKDHLLNELSVRAEYFCKRADGSYDVPRMGGQCEQVIEMAIAAALKSQEPQQENEKANVLTYLIEGETIEIDADLKPVINALADRLARLMGYDYVLGYDFSKSIDPRSQLAWSMAVNAYFEFNFNGLV